MVILTSLLYISRLDLPRYQDDPYGFTYVFVVYVRTGLAQVPVIYMVLLTSLLLMSCFSTLWFRLGLPRYQ